MSEHRMGVSLTALAAALVAAGCGGREAESAQTVERETPSDQIYRVGRTW
jgi:hypothetical protein